MSETAQSEAIDARALIGAADILLVTFDSLRFDVAERARADDATPTLAALLPGGVWERRHSPASFTFAAHQAFFAGFLPTPARPGRHERLFAVAFEGSRSTGRRTAVFDAPDIVSGLRAAGYRAICIGGVGFFSRATPLASVLPDLFDESWWSPAMGVSAVDAPARQAALAAERLAATPADQRVFLFINVSATHTPTRIFAPGAMREGPQTQALALAAADRAFADLVPALTHSGRRWLAILTSDHGSAFGEDGYRGHRIGHHTVWDVPYAETMLEPTA